MNNISDNHHFIVFPYVYLLSALYCTLYLKWLRLQYLVSINVTQSGQNASCVQSIGVAYSALGYNVFHS